MTSCPAEVPPFRTPCPSQIPPPDLLEFPTQSWQLYSREIRELSSDLGQPGLNFHSSMEELPKSFSLTYFMGFL